MCFTLKTTLEKDGRNSTNSDFLTWSIQNFVRTVKQFVRKYYITWIIYLANKLYDREKFIDFILCHVLLKIALSWGYPLWLTCMSSTEKQGQSNFKFYWQKIKMFNSNKQKRSLAKGWFWWKNPCKDMEKNYSNFQNCHNQFLYLKTQPIWAWKLQCAQFWQNQF